MEEWLKLPEEHRMTLPFFEQNLLTDTTNQATAYWIAMPLHANDLVSGNIYIIHMLIEDQGGGFNFLWPMKCVRDAEGGISWQYAVNSEGLHPVQPAPADVKCIAAAGLVLHIDREQEPVDFGWIPGQRLN